MTPTLKNDRFLRALRREPVDATPVWLMRQAGRYLPEYRATRAKAGSFLAMARTRSSLAKSRCSRWRASISTRRSCSPTSSPCPMRWAWAVFRRGRRPEVRASRAQCRGHREVGRARHGHELRYVMDAVSVIRRELDGRVPLIGFSGSPWTLACYMVEGGGSDNFSKVKRSRARRSEGDACVVVGQHRCGDRLSACAARSRCAGVAGVRYVGRCVVAVDVSRILAAVSARASRASSSAAMRR